MKSRWGGWLSLVVMLWLCYNLARLVYRLAAAGKVAAAPGPVRGTLTGPALQTRPRRCRDPPAPPPADAPGGTPAH